MNWDTLKELFTQRTYIKQMSTITINGKTYAGHNISVINGKVFIDGNSQDDDTLSGVVRIEVKGDLASLECDAPVVVTGNVKGNVKCDGPVTCGDVEGNVDADGPVTCGNVKGNVEADGPCTCGNVGGDVKAEIICKS